MSRRVIYGISVIALIIVLNLNGCSHPTNKSVSEMVDLYYKEFEPSNKGNLKILAQKPVDNKIFLLAEKYSGDGHSLTELFLVNKDKVIERRANGLTPISMCFSANKVDYENGTIIFGNFNDTKWDIKSDTKKPIEIEYIVVKFKNGEIVKENVGKGYIIHSSTQSDLESIELYNAGGQLQSDLNEIGEVERMKFVDVSLQI